MPTPSALIEVTRKDEKPKRCGSTAMVTGCVTVIVQEPS
jgi:hypothetical protein